MQVPVTSTFPLGHEVQLLLIVLQVRHALSHGTHDLLLLLYTYPLAHPLQAPPSTTYGYWHCAHWLVDDEQLVQ